MRLMFLVSSDGDVKHYFYCSKEKMNVLRHYLHKEYPKLNICGMNLPSSSELTSEEDMEDIEKINESRADIIWVGFDPPKQERWMKAHKGKVNGVIIGVGAGFDRFAGIKPKGWLKRHLVTNIKCLIYLLGEFSDI